MGRKQVTTVILAGAAVVSTDAARVASTLSVNRTAVGLLRMQVGKCGRESCLILIFRGERSRGKARTEGRLRYEVRKEQQNEPEESRRGGVRRSRNSLKNKSKRAATKPKVAAS